MKKYLIMLFIGLSISAWGETQIVFLGDSLTAGYGIEKENAYPNLVEQKLKDKGKNVKVLNGGVSGSTTASGKSRLKWFLKKAKPEVLVLALGANDGLRGVKLSESEKNLEEIISLAKKEGLKVLLAGMQMPPNYGKEYTQSFKSMFTNLQKQHELPMIPFILEKVGGNKDLNIEDGIHPNEEGHKVIADTVMKYLEPLL